MNENNKLSLVDGNTIEIHYWFVDNTHSMDAFVQNKCEYEFLGILKEIATTFKVHITIETEPLEEGGLRRWFKIATKDENKKGTITIALITALATGVIVTPITTSIGKISEKLVEEIFEDPETKELEKEKLRLEIKKLRQETSENTQIVDSSNVVKRKKSNFYETLQQYPKVDKVSFLIVDEDKKVIVEEKTVYRKDFKEYVLSSDDLEPLEVDDAIIEIISPVLKKGNYIWKGIFRGEPVPFSMKSQEFKNLVQTGEVQFRNGTSINCFLTIKRKIDNEGKERITGIEVNRVNSFFENEKPIETPEGKKYRQKKDEEKKQLELFARKEGHVE